jgi:hypothetical protein
LPALTRLVELDVSQLHPELPPKAGLYLALGILGTNATKP